MTTAAVHWSGGKDSALALSLLLAAPGVEVAFLVTTVHPQRGASTVHGIPVELLETQARALGLPLRTVPMPGPGLDGYVPAMNAAAARMRDEGIGAFAFGDLGCSDVRRHKEAQFGPLGIEVLEPLEEFSSSGQAVEAFLASGMRAVTVVVDADVLAADRVGVPLDRSFVDRLPPGVDPCGEFGEYHTFVFDGPMFRSPVPFELDPPRFLERDIGTTDGVRRYRYWLATPRPAGA